MKNNKWYIALFAVMVILVSACEGVESAVNKDETSVLYGLEMTKVGNTDLGYNITEEHRNEMKSFGTLEGDDDDFKTKWNEFVVNIHGSSGAPLTVGGMTSLQRSFICDVFFSPDIEGEKSKIKAFYDGYIYLINNTLLFREADKSVVITGVKKPSIKAILSQIPISLGETNLGWVMLKFGNVEVAVIVNLSEEPVDFIFDDTLTLSSSENLKSTQIATGTSARIPNLPQNTVTNGKQIDSIEKRSIFVSFYNKTDTTCNPDFYFTGKLIQSTTDSVGSK